MSIEGFAHYSSVLHGLTVDFVRAVPDDTWDFMTDPLMGSGTSMPPLPVRYAAHLAHVMGLVMQPSCTLSSALGR